MLAIAAPRFNAPSETFIRNHVRSIAPGETILLCRNGEGAEALGCPVLSGIDDWQRPKSLPKRIINGVRYRWHAYVDPGLSGGAHTRVRSFLNTHNARALLAEYGPTGCLVALACHEAGVPLYVHFHGYDASRALTERRWRRHYRTLFGAAAGVIAPSEFLVRRLLHVGCPETKLHVSPYGVDPQRFSPTRRRPQRIVAVGRLVEKKAPHLTIEAFARIAPRFPEAKLEMVGEGVLADRCQTLIRDLAVEDQVCMHGVQTSGTVVRLMQEASVFVQHSLMPANGDCEGLPVAILEAMASALPVVSTRHSGIPEAVLHGATGLLIHEHDVTGMAEAMAGLLEDPARAAAMGAAGRQRVLQHYTVEYSRDRLRAIMGLPALAPTEPLFA